MYFTAKPVQSSKSWINCRCNFGKQGVTVWTIEKIKTFVVLFSCFVRISVHSVNRKISITKGRILKRKIGSLGFVQKILKRCLVALTTEIFFICFIQSASTFQSITIANHVFVGHAFTSFHSTDWSICTHSCREETKCVSYNYDKSQNSGGLCELNNHGIDDLCHANELHIYSPGFIFQQIRESKVRRSKCCRCF